MRRPLFMVCLCLVIIMAVRMVLWGEKGRHFVSPSGVNAFSDEHAASIGEVALEVPEGDSAGILFQELDGQQIVVTGQVYQKDTKAFYIENVVLHSVIQQTFAAGQQQAISISKEISGKLLCEYGVIANGAAQYDTEADVNTNKTNEKNAGRGETEGTDEIAEAIRLGSTVKLQGKLYLYESATNPGEFDAKAYYGSLGIAGKLKSTILLEAGEEYSLWQEGLFQVKEYFRQRLHRIFPEKEAGVMTAMLLGDKSGLDSDLKALYQDNGIIHILSISGLHITIIGMSIYKLLRRLGMPVLPAAALGGMVLLLYGFMSGMSVSACRAIGMYLIHMLAEGVGRTYDMLTALGIMAAVMLWQNPAYLQNAGFYLSFGAVLGIGVLYPALAVEKADERVTLYEEKEWNRRLTKLIRQWGEDLRQSMLAGASITLTTLPILLWFYYEVPVYSVLINLLILPFMSCVLLTGLFAMLVPGLGIVGTVDCVILTWYEQLCQWFEKLPFHTWNPGRPQVWQMVVYYAVWLGVAFLGNLQRKRIEEQRDKEKKEKRRAYDKQMVEEHANEQKKWKNKIKNIWNGRWAMAAAVFLFSVNARREASLTFLDVGQGDCICLQTASGEVYLFDCGSSSRSNVGEYVLKPFLKYSGIQHIDAVFVSHPDTDHCSGIEDLLASGEEWGVTVGQLVLPNIQDKEADEKLCELKNAAEQAAQKDEIVIRYVASGDAWQMEGLQFLCLHPPMGWENEDSNAYSECFYVKFADAGLELLLTGDVGGEGEALLLEELQERGIEGIDLLKVAHHGSRNSTSEELLMQIRPTLSIISCSEDNSYGHPHEDTLKRLERVGSMVMATKYYGAVTVEIGNEVAVYGFTK